MRISEKRKQLAYNTMSDSIIKLRIELARNKHDQETIDKYLFQLEQKIWKDFCKTLNIEGEFTND